MSAAFGALEALRGSGRTARVDDDDRLRIGPSDRIDENVRGLINRHRDGLLELLAAERAYATGGWDPVATEVLWRAVGRAYDLAGEPSGGWVEVALGRVDAAWHHRDPAAYWYACHLFVREASRHVPVAARLRAANPQRTVA